MPGTIDIPISGSLTTWVWWLLPYDRHVYLLADESAFAGCAESAASALLRPDT
jgi:hypothetical protein